MCHLPSLLIHILPTTTNSNVNNSTSHVHKILADDMAGFLSRAR